MAGMSRREHFYAEVERLKERYRQLSTSYLQGQLPLMSIKECATAAKAVLAERENGEPEPVIETELG